MIEKWEISKESVSTLAVVCEAQGWESPVGPKTRVICLVVTVMILWETFQDKRTHGTLKKFKWPHLPENSSSNLCQLRRESLKSSMISTKQKKSSGANLTSRASMTSSCFSFPPIVLVALTWFLFSRSKTSKTSDTGRTNCILPDMKTATFWKPRIYPTLKDAFFSWWRFFTSGRVKCSYWFTNHIHFSMVGTLVLVSFCVHIWLISAVRSTKKVTLQKKNLRCPHFWATIIDATFGWIDPKKVNSWIHPTVKSVELISWWKREKLLTFVERWDSKGGDNAEIKDVCMLWGWNLIIF